MKTEEDEAFEELAKRQGMWGGFSPKMGGRRGGFKAKRAAAADKLQEPAEWLTGCPTCGMDAGCDCDTGTWNPPQPAQEPVALVIDGVLVKSELPEKYTGHLYTTPPKREWVGLKDGEVTEGLCRTRYALQTAVAWVDGVEWATKQLKEKNSE